MKYVKGFDTIRALAVFFVIVDKYHWGPALNEHSIPGMLKEIFIPNGRFGVNLFFVLSGFLITSILLQEKFKNVEGKKFFIIKNFFARRILRIFPIYYITVFVCYAFNFPIVKHNLGYFLTYTSNLLQYHTTETNQLLHTWSLAVEEQFYLIWPWLVILLNKKYLKYIFIGAILIGIVSKYIELYILHYDSYSVFSCFDSFGIGALYAYIRLNKAYAPIFEKRFRIVFPLLLFIAWRLAPIAGLPVIVIYNKVLENIIAMALIMFTINNRSEWIRKYILENKAFNFIGKISYGLYLYHFILGPIWDNFTQSFARDHTPVSSLITNFYCSYCIKLTLLIVLSWLSFKFIEQPILRLKNKFEYA